MQPEIDERGTKRWYKDGKLHREDGPAFESENGYKSWYINGKRHREDGPAIEDTNGGKYWYINGKLHREDGPAIEEENRDKSWWINDKYVSETEHKANFKRIRKLQYKYYYKWVEWHFDPNRKGSKVYQNLYEKLQDEVGEFLN